LYINFLYLAATDTKLLILSYYKYITNQKLQEKNNTAKNSAADYHMQN